MTLIKNPYFPKTGATVKSQLFTISFDFYESHLEIGLPFFEIMPKMILWNNIPSLTVEVNRNDGVQGLRDLLQKISIDPKKLCILAINNLN